jgi:hypothetical protein
MWSQLENKRRQPANQQWTSKSAMTDKGTPTAGVDCPVIIVPSRSNPSIHNFWKSDARDRFWKLEVPERARTNRQNGALADDMTEEKDWPNGRLAAYWLKYCKAGPSASLWHLKLEPRACSALCTPVSAGRICQIHRLSMSEALGLVTMTT